MSVLDRVLSRRRLLAGAAGTAGAFALGRRPVEGADAPQVHAPSAAHPLSAVRMPPSHLVWVWDFTRDGPPDPIRETLAEYGFGIALKTHNGIDWMSKYDHSQFAVDGPKRVAQLVDSFESHGVPFYAWCVARGTHPADEAKIAADVLAAGPRGLFVDVESYPGFWSGTFDDATDYGKRLREASPDASVLMTLDARPWEMGRIPLKEFSSFASAIAPQVYWNDFSTPPNVAKYRKEGEEPDTSDITPTFALDAAVRKLTSLDFPPMPLMPIGPGTADDADAWKQFIEGSFSHLARSVSVWRFGTVSEAVLELLKQHPAPATYAVQPGDYLGALAAAWDTSVDEIVRWNDLANPDFVRIGQELVIPPTAQSPASTTYEVQPGDTLLGLAAQWHTTTDRIAELNGIDDQQYIRIGQHLVIPPS